MKTIVITIMALMLVSFTSANIFGFLNNFESQFEPQMCMSVPNILDNVNAIINDTYWTEYWRLHKPYVSSGSGPGSSSGSSEPQSIDYPKNDYNRDRSVNNDDINALKSLGTQLVEELTDNDDEYVAELDFNEDGLINNNDISAYYQAEQNLADELTT